MYDLWAKQWQEEEGGEEEEEENNSILKAQKLFSVKSTRKIQAQGETLE